MHVRETRGELDASACRPPCPLAGLNRIGEVGYLKGQMGGELHALALETLTPEEA